MKDFKNIPKEELLDVIDELMVEQNKKQYQVLRELALDSRVIGKYRHQLGRQLKTKTSSLEERVFYCKKILNGCYTIEQVAEITGYNKRTIAIWLEDYAKYGENITKLATGFSHV